MRGSVRKRGAPGRGTWTRRGPVTGKRRQAMRRLRTKREAQDALNETLARLREEPSSLPRSAPSGASCWRSGFLPSGRPGSGRRPGRATG